MKLLLVDDETAIREHIKLMLGGSGWEVLEAENGEQALAILAREGADVLLTDIRMPVMDGLELIKRCRLASRGLPAIVLSNYAEFALAQQALQLGAENYLLKATVTADELLGELERVGRRLSENRRMAAKLDGNDLIMLLNSLFHERLTGAISTAELLQRADKYGLSFFREADRPSQFAVLSVDDFAKWTDERFRGRIDLAIFALTNAVRELARGNHPHNDVFHLFDGQFAVTDLAQLSLERHVAAVAEIKEKLRCVLGLDTSFIAGYPFSGLDELFAQAANVRHDMEKLFYEPRSCIVDVDELRRQPEQDLADIYYYFQSLSGERLTATPERLDGWVESFFDLLAAARRPPLVVREDVQFLIRFIEDQGYAVGTRFRERIGAMRPSRLNDYRAAFTEWLREHQLSGMGRSEVYQCIAYIHSHYREKISIDDICAHVNISRSHLSKLFKEQQGMTIVEYVEQFRLNQARLLLRSTPLSVSDVAEHVGIPDIFYFSKLYKKCFKVNPSKDRMAP